MPNAKGIDAVVASTRSDGSSLHFALCILHFAFAGSAPVKRHDDYRAPGLIYPARLEPDKIGLLVMLVEGHEGLAIVRTKDPALGTVEFWVSPLMQAVFEDFLTALHAELGVMAGPPRIADVAAIDQL